MQNTAATVDALCSLKVAKGAHCRCVGTDKPVNWLGCDAILFLTLYAINTYRFYQLKLSNPGGKILFEF